MIIITIIIIIKGFTIHHLFNAIDQICLSRMAKKSE